MSYISQCYTYVNRVLSIFLRCYSCAALSQMTCLLCDAITFVDSAHEMTGELNDKRYWSDLFDANECIARRRYVSVTKTGKLSRSKWHTWVPCLFQGCLKLISQSYVNTVVVKSNLSTVWERPWLECYCWLLHNVKSFVSTFLRNLPDLKFAIVAL